MQRNYCGSVMLLLLGDGDGDASGLSLGAEDGFGGSGFADGDAETVCRCGWCECGAAVDTNVGSADGVCTSETLTSRAASLRVALRTIEAPGGCFFSNRDCSSWSSFAISAVLFGSLDVVAISLRNW